MGSMTYYMFDVAMVTLGIAFILFCIHTTLLAAGRRQTAAIAGSAGGTTTVTTTDSSNTTPAGGMAQAFVWVSFVLVGVGLLIRAYLVGRGPWGNLYEFSVAFSFGIMGGYLFLSRRYPIKAIAFVPIGVAFFLLTYAFTLPAEISPLVPALNNPPLLVTHFPRGMIGWRI